MFAALFDGLDVPRGPAVSFNISPGAGEILQMAPLTADGPGTSLLVDALPGGPLEPFAEVPATDPGVIPMLTDLLRVHAPAGAERIRPGFALRGPDDRIQGAITPTVRRARAPMPSGTPALAIGDAWITNDPLTGQGANLGSHSAWVAVEHIASHLASPLAGGAAPFDRASGERLEQAMSAYAGPVTSWTNAFLQPPPPHLVELNLAAARHQAVADRLVRLFADPPAMLRATASPDSVRRFDADALAAQPGEAAA